MASNTRPGPIAVIVLSHRYPGQVARLVARITDGGDTVAVVHHDPSGEPLRLPPSSRVALIPDPVPCQWGRLSLVTAVRKSLLWARANVPDLSWALVVSGQDYPIRAIGSIEAELGAARCDAFLRHFRSDGDPADDVHPWQATTRRRYLYRRRLPGSARSVPLPWARRHPYHDGVHLYAGDMWVNLSARAVRKVLDSPLNGPLLAYLRRSPVPDETWAATVALNGSPELAVVNDSRRYIRWPRGASHPAALRPADLAALTQSGAFFARKVDLAHWPQACDQLDDLARDRR
jgi:Core-2/I-Branching enzyme